MKNIHLRKVPLEPDMFFEVAQQLVHDTAAGVPMLRMPASQVASRPRPVVHLVKPWSLAWYCRDSMRYAHGADTSRDVT